MSAQPRTTQTKFVSLILSASLLAFALSSSIQLTGASTQAPQSNFVVNSTDDTGDINQGDGTCADGAGKCTLRAALNEASATQYISHTITFDAALTNATFAPAIDSLILSGSYVTVDGGTRNIKLSGVNLEALRAVMTVKGSYNTVKNLTFIGAPANADDIQIRGQSGVGEGSHNTLQNLVTYGSPSGAGIGVYEFTGGGGLNNKLINNVIGVSSASATACVESERNLYGIRLGAGTIGTTIDGNLIVCNSSDGIFLRGNNAVVVNNRIGTNGTIGLTNKGNGINMRNGAQSNVIGDNVISGNNVNGVLLSEGSSFNQIRANRIGTNSAGTAALPNGQHGVMLSGGSGSNAVGGNSAVDRNIISGNALNGILLTDAGTDNNLIDSNFIGLNAAGAAAIPNGSYGIGINNAQYNNIGSNSATPLQFISGNTKAGIIAVSTNCLLAQINISTYIGLAANATSPLGNGEEGVLIAGGNCVYVGAGRISYNGKAGIAVTGNSSSGNRFFPRQVSENGGLAVDLGNDGYTANGSKTPPGPNHWVIHPFVTTINGSTVTGKTCDNCKVIVYKAIGDPTANGGGGTYSSELQADGGGNWSTPLNGGLTVSNTTFMSRDIDGSHSEFSPRPVTPAKVDQTINFPTISDKTLISTTFTLSASASSGLVVTFTSQTPSICAVSGISVTLLTTGTCTIRAAQSGSYDYNAAPNVDRSFSINKVAQTITFGTLLDKTFGDASFTLSATASSSLTVTFTSLTLSVCSVNGTTVTLLGVGTCTIRASQGGNTVYAAAPDMDRTFFVQSRTRTIYLPLVIADPKES